MQEDTSDVRRFPVTRHAHSDHADDYPDLETGQGFMHNHRVQIRLPLEDLGQTERSLIILQAAVERSLTQVRAARKRQDDAALIAVRGLFEVANKALNVKTHTRRRTGESTG